VTPDAELSPPPPAAVAGEGAVRNSARPWRVLGAICVGALVLAAFVITALRIAIAYLPENADRLRGWIERQTGTRIEYDALDARLRWYGPEVVVRRLRVLDHDGTQALFAAREGSVGLDLWNFFRTGQFVAGRVRVAEPRMTVVRLVDGRIRLLGQAERPADRPPFDFDRLPAGRVVVEDATVIYRDLKSGAPPLELRNLQGGLRRDRDFVVIEGTAQLPAALGSTAQFDVRLKGSLDDPARLDGRVDLQVVALKLAGLAPYLPSGITHAKSGQGDTRVVLAVRAGQLAKARLKLALRGVVLPIPARTVPAVEAVRVGDPRVETAAGAFMPHPTITRQMLERPAPSLPAEARFAVLEGDARLRREGAGWSFRLLGLRTAERDPRDGAHVTGTWWGRPVTRFGLELDAKDIDVGALWPLALACAPKSFDRWAGAGPAGRIRSLRIKAGRDRAGLTPAFEVSADLAGLAVNALGKFPGVSGITAKIDGSDERGRIELRSSAPTFEMPRLFTAPMRFTRANADVTWRHEGATWVVTTRGAQIVHPQARALVDAELRYDMHPDVSPVLDMNASVEDIDVAATPKFIPYGKLHEPTIAWLDRAFIGGKASHGRFSCHGPVRKFPFRHSEGEFLATAEVSGASLDYYPGFDRLTDARAKVEFHNQSIKAELTAGQVGDVHLSHASFTLTDYHAPVLLIGAEASGDLARALSFVQASPLGPRIGPQFMGLRGNGPARYDVRLTLPILSPEALAELEEPKPQRDYYVRADLDNVNVSLPALRAPAQRVSGIFELHNLDITVPSIRGTILDGPFELQASPGRTSRDVLAAVDLTAHGRAAGARLPAFIGLPATIRMSGATDWDLRGRIEQHGTGDWPLQFDVTSALAGLEIFAPHPFAKPSPETRATHVRIELPGQAYNDLTIESGSARAKLRFAVQNGQWRLDRGTARFDGQPVALSTQHGLLVAGDWPQFDLAEWLALGGETATPAATAGPTLMDWLGPVDVHLDRATVYGFEFRDVVAKLRGEGDAWHVAVNGPSAEGQVTVPADLSRGKPIVLEMKHLQLLSEANADADVAPAAPAAPATPTDPRKLPAITAHADDFSWQNRRFGRLNAVISKDPRGITFDKLAASGDQFAIDAKGSWLMEAGGPRTRLAAELTTTDFSAMARALAYRDSIDAKKGHITTSLWWPGGPSGDVLKTLNGTMHFLLEDGQMRDIQPGAGRMLGLLSVAQLPRRLALDFSDVTDKGLAFNSIKGDFELRNGDAYTQNLLLKGPAVNMGIVGRTGLGAEDYDQTIVVSGNTGGPLAVAGALAAGPVVGAGVLVLSQLFKDQLQGLARVYYHVSGPWAAPVVQRIAASAAETAAPGAGAARPEISPKDDPQ
jgi:uncharacterized protein (TIGR02099 family)